MYKRKKIRLAITVGYFYSVDIQIIDSSKYLCYELGYLGKLSLFERYGLFVLVNEAFGKNVFFLMILINIFMLLKNVV